VSKRNIARFSFSERKSESDLLKGKRVPPGTRDVKGEEARESDHAEEMLTG